MKKLRQFQSGQSLVEIVVVVGTVVLLVSGLIVATTTSLKTTRLSTTRSPAIKYAQEGVEQARKMRDTSWSSFLAQKDAPGGLWCLGIQDTWTMAQGDEENCQSNIDAVFSRVIQFTWDAPNNRMLVQSTVSWNDGGVIRQSDVSTYFTNWR